MEKPRSNVTQIKNQELYQKFNNLERDWAVIKETRSLDSCSDTMLNMRYKFILGSSPRALMSSLQEKKVSPSNESWKVRTNDLAIQEIIQERRAAIASGKLKGRRLFVEFEDDIYSDNVDVIQNSELKPRVSNGVYVSDDEIDDQSSSCLDFAFSSERLGMDQQVFGCKEVNQRQERKDKGLKSSGNGKRLIFAMAFFAMVSMLIAFGFNSMSCNGEYVHGPKVMLVPT